MGLSSKKTTTKTTPHDPASVKAGTDALHGVYNQWQPRVMAAADKTLGLQDEMIDKWRAGNPAVNAATDYVTTTLGGDATNPHLDAWIAQTQDEAQNRTGAAMNKMGLGPAGSTYQTGVGREVGKIGLGMRYADWDAAQNRKANAAGMAPGLAAADVIQIAPMLSATQLGANLPMDNTARYAAGIGGLLAPYNTTTQKTSGGFLGDLMLAIAANVGSFGKKGG